MVYRRGCVGGGVSFACGVVLVETAQALADKADAEGAAAAAVPKPHTLYIH